MTRGGWCSSCGPAESSKLFASVHRATHPGDSRFRPNSTSLISTVHVDDDGNTCRWTYIEFYSRYSILMSQQEADLSDKKQTCKNVLQRVIQVRLSAVGRQDIHLFLLCDAFVMWLYLYRTPTNTSLAARRSFSARVRSRIWRSCVWTGSGEPV